jgi:hypothetical protein
MMVVVMMMMMLVMVIMTMIMTGNRWRLSSNQRYGVIKKSGDCSTKNTQKYFK